MAVGFNRLFYGKTGENRNINRLSAGYDIGLLYGYCLTWNKCTAQPKPGKQTFF